MSVENSDLDWTVKGRPSWGFWVDLWSVRTKEMDGSGLHVEKSISDQQH